jgi:hypothetical protein
MLKFAVIAAGVAVAASTVSSAAIPNAEAAANCPTYAARSAQCKSGNQDKCVSQGTGCFFDCSYANDRSGCDEVALPGDSSATYCQSTRQETDTSFGSCRTNCSAFSNKYQDCYGATSSQCVHYDGRCQDLITSGQTDGEACNNSVAAAESFGAVSIKKRFNDSLPSNKCRAKCDLFPSAWLCSRAQGCHWDKVNGICHQTCGEWYNAEDCNSVFGCAWQKHLGCTSAGKVCKNLDSKEDCYAASCAWVDGKCYPQCSSVQFPADTDNYEASLLCLSYPLCGYNPSGSGSCFTSNCSLLTSDGRRECDNANGCKWIGSSDDEGECRLSCESEWQRRQTCSTHYKNDTSEQLVCWPLVDNDGAIQNCYPAACGNYTALGEYACANALSIYGSCRWAYDEQKCISFEDRCSAKSLVPVAPATKSACELSPNCEPFFTWDKEGNLKSAVCYNKCNLFSSPNACGNAADGCMVDAESSKCVRTCSSFSNASSCDAMDHCIWYNNSMAVDPYSSNAKPYCAYKCTRAGKYRDFCNSQYNEYKCVFFGGTDCGCQRECESQPDNECPGQCSRSSIFGGLCISPRKPGNNCVIELSAGQIVGIVIGVVAFVCIVGVIIYCVFFRKPAESADPSK